MEEGGEDILYNIIIIIITNATSRLKGDYNVRKWNMLLGVGVLNPTDAIGHWVQGLTSVCYWQNQPVNPTDANGHWGFKPNGCSGTYS